MIGGVDESMAILLLPGEVEVFERGAHARSLLSIPRVVALEPSKRRAPGFLRGSATLRQARRLQLPGRLALVVLYHPAQYPLARALCAEHERAELWYLPPDPRTLETSDPGKRGELEASDELARERATEVLATTPSAQWDDADPLRRRLRELDVISSRAFLPEGRFARSRRR
jgi:hypothetical protein